MNKKAFLLASETVKIVIAVICIVFLVYFLTSLYFSKITEEKGRQAEATLKSGKLSIEKSILDAQKNSPVQKYTLTNPEGWYFFSFTGSEKKPNSCAGQNCLCICENVWDFFERQTKYCDEDGACLIIQNLEDNKIEKELLKNVEIVISYESGIIKLNIHSEK